MRRSFLLILILISLAFATPAFAFSVTDGGTLTNSWGNADYTSVANKYTNASITPLTSVTAKIRNSAPSARTVSLYVWEGGAYPGQGTLLTSATSSVSVNSTGQNVTFDVDDKILSANTVYWYEFYGSESTRYFISHTGTGSGVTGAVYCVPGLCGNGNLGNGWSTMAKPVTMSTSEIIAQPQTPTLALTYPENRSVFSSDFSHFVFDLNTTANMSGSVTVYYGLQNSSTTYSSESFGASYPAGTAMSVYVQKLHPLSGMQWAYGVFKDLSGSVLATSTTAYWSNQGYTMSYTGAPIIDTIAPTSTAGMLLGPDDPNSQWYVDCSSYTTLDPAGWVCAVKKGGLWLVYNLIVPHASFVAYFDWGLSIFHSAFPFNVLFGFLSDMEQLLSEVGTTSETLYLPVLGTQVAVFDQTQMADIMGNSNYNTLMTTMGAIIWVICAVAMYVQARSLVKKK